VGKEQFTNVRLGRLKVRRIPTLEFTQSKPNGFNEVGVRYAVSVVAMVRTVTERAHFTIAGGGCLKW